MNKLKPLREGRKFLFFDDDGDLELKELQDLEIKLQDDYFEQQICKRVDLYKEGKFQKALDYFDKLITLFPENCLAYSIKSQMITYFSKYIQRLKRSQKKAFNVFLNNCIEFNPKNYKCLSIKRFINLMKLAFLLILSEGKQCVGFNVLKQNPYIYNMLMKRENKYLAGTTKISRYLKIDVGNNVFKIILIILKLLKKQFQLIYYQSIKIVKGIKVQRGNYILGFIYLVQSHICRSGLRSLRFINNIL
ncbi:hypothetical protein pb186bvf_014697, partial [Paramecium bursaria]